MTYEDILYRVEDGVAVITLNRPDRLNAWRGEMGRDVKAAMRAASDDDAVRVTIRDTGRGIDPAIQEKIFEPFFTTKDVGEGTGLGLAIVKTIMDLHGGTVQASSPPGGRTEFRLVFPA